MIHIITKVCIMSYAGTTIPTKIQIFLFNLKFFEIGTHRIIVSQKCMPHILLLHAACACSTILYSKQRYHIFLDQQINKLPTRQKISFTYKYLGFPNPITSLMMTIDR